MSILRSALVCRRLMWARTRADAQYRLSFVLRSIAACAVLLTDSVSLFSLERRFGSIGGWTLWPLMFVFGMSSTTFRLSDALIGGSVERSSELVRTGRLDVLLARPMGLMWLIIGDAFAVRRVLQMLSVLPFAVVALVNIDVDWNMLRVVVCVLMVVNSFAVFSSVFVLVNALSFWSPNTQEIANAFTYGGATVAQYPLHVMDRWIRVLSMSVLPVGVTAYLPTFLLLDVPNPLGITSLQSWASLFVGVPITLLAALTWQRAIRRYRSTGS